MPSALLALEDGSLFYGESIGVPGQAVGEVVFNTAMTGYQEILTDPSYARQIVTLTYPHIGNTGANPEDMESGNVYTAGLVVRDLPPMHSNFRAAESLPEFMRRYKLIGIAGIDTRRLTRLLREKGAQNGCILAIEKGGKINKKEALKAARVFPGLKGMDLAKVVSTRKPYSWDEGPWQLGKGHAKQVNTRFHVVAYDYGIKRNILRMLAARG
ncbi:MAG: carbamoyl-phosphate synthase small subunit, partial [Gammaproteobacteria bacterium]|nr:carbamoyl-phosphate synthase small subunit [Gammaproteobacteria bacterium]